MKTKNLIDSKQDKMNQLFLMYLDWLDWHSYLQHYGFHYQQVNRDQVQLLLLDIRLTKQSDQDYSFKRIYLHIKEDIYYNDF